MRLLRTLLLAGAASAAFAYPTPEELHDNDNATALYSAQADEAFVTDNFDKTALRIEPGLCRSADEITRARVAMKHAALGDRVFRDIIRDYKGLIGAYHQLLLLYENARQGALATPDDANAKALLESMKSARNLVFQGLQAKFAILEARYKVLRGGVHL
jgi:hypothetical protein